MQLLKDGNDYRLEFEVLDFEYRRTTFEWFEKFIEGALHRDASIKKTRYKEMIEKYQKLGFFVGGSFLLNCQKWVDTFTQLVNQRLSYFCRGKKGENTKYWAILIFKYLWRPIESEEERYFQWIPLNEISRNLVRYRKVGRPHGPRKDKLSQNYLEIEENPITHYTTLLRILSGLVDTEMIEYKKTIVDNPQNSQKKRENAFYRISEKIFQFDITQEEQLIRLREDNALLLKIIDNLQVNNS